MEKLKNLFRAFVLTATAVSCAAAVFSAALTARARTQKVIDGSRYAVAAFNTHGESFGLEEENDEVRIKIPAEKALEELKRLLPFTPFGAAYCFFETVSENR